MSLCMSHGIFEGTSETLDISLVYTCKRYEDFGVSDFLSGSILDVLSAGPDYEFAASLHLKDYIKKMVQYFNPE